MIETPWLKIQGQLELLRNIWPKLDEEYQSHQSVVLEILHGKAQAAISLIDSINGNANNEMSIQKRSKYAVKVKTNLKFVLNDLKDWSEVFDLSWYLILQLSNTELDQELRPISHGENSPLSKLRDLREAITSNLKTQAEAEKKTVFLPQNFFANTHYTRLESGPSVLGVWFDAKTETRYLIDQPSNTSTLPDVCKLAKIFKRVEPLEFGILACKGVAKFTTDGPATTSKATSASVSASRFLFTIPSNLTEPQYRTLISWPYNYALDERFSISKQAAKAVMFIHSVGFVHNNIRLETILILRDQESRSGPQAFLTRFQSFRLAGGLTLYQGDDEWEKNLYRHPKRQGVSLDTVYSMQHNIYSLGVCLL